MVIWNFQEDNFKVFFGYNLKGLYFIYFMSAFTEYLAKGLVF